MMKTMLDIYKGLPQGIKRALKYGYSMIPLQWRLGRDFFNQLNFLEKSQWWSKQALENYQNEQLQKLIRHVWNFVPYYHELLKNNKLAPDDIRTINDLPKIPILTKQEIRDNWEKLWARNYKKEDLVVESTSGTSGISLKILCDPANEYWEGGPFEWRFFRLGGLKFGDQRAYFRGHTVRGAGDKKRVFYSYNPVSRKLYFSIFDIRKENIEEYARIISKYRPKFISCNPGALSLFVTLLKEEGIPEIIPFKSVFSIGELLTEEMRRNIESYFKLKMFDWYGMEERVVIGAECERHEGHHVISDYGITEFVKFDHVDKTEIVATGFNNYAMPLIRYRTCDTAELLDKPCSCGRGFPLMKIFGGERVVYIQDKNRNSIPVYPILERVADNIKQFQYVHDGKGHVAIKIVKAKGYSLTDERNIQDRVVKELGNNCDIRIDYVEKVLQTETGKIPLAIMSEKL